MTPSGSASPPPGTRGRQRPGAACEECRRRKLRCNGQKPQCGFCLESRVACEVNPYRASRGPKKGYLKALKDRVGITSLLKYFCLLSGGLIIVSSRIAGEWSCCTAAGRAKPPARPFAYPAHRSYRRDDYWWHSRFSSAVQRDDIRIQSIP